MNKLKFIIPLIILLAIGFNIASAACPSPTAFPSGIAYYVCVTWTNNQNINVVGLTPLQFTFNGLKYQLQESNTLNNTELFYANGTVDNSFIEGNLLNLVGNANILYQSQNTIWWQQSPVSNTYIGASASNYIFIGFTGNFPNSGNNLWTTSIGATFQLANTIVGIGTSTAKSEDSGANVFSSYTNFGSLAALPSGWSLATGGSTNPGFLGSNILMFNSNVIIYTSTNGLPYSYNTPGNTVDWMVNATGSGGSGATGVTATQENNFQNNRWLLGLNGECSLGQLCFHTQGSPGFVNALTPNAFEPSTKNIWSFSYTALTTANVYANYSLLTAIGTGATNPLTVDTTYGIRTIRIDSSNFRNYYYWIRTRPNPPNNAMPAVTFGAITNTLTTPASTETNSILDVPQVTTQTANPSNGLTPYTYKWYTNYGTSVDCTGNNGNAISGATSITYVASPTTSNAYAYQVTDNAGAIGCSSATTETTYSKPIGTFTFSNTLLDSGQTENAILSITGGIGPFSANLINVTVRQGTANLIITSNAGASNGIFFVVTSPTNNNAFTMNYIFVDYGDSTNTLYNAVAQTFTVNTAIASAVTITPLNAILTNPPVSETWTGTVSGGVLPYTFNWIVESPQNIIAGNLLSQSITVTNSFTFNFLSIGYPYTVNLVVSDSATTNSIANSVNSVITIQQGVVQANGGGGGGSGTTVIQISNSVNNTITYVSNTLSNISPSGIALNINVFVIWSLFSGVNIFGHNIWLWEILLTGFFIAFIWSGTDYLYLIGIIVIFAMLFYAAYSLGQPISL